MYFVWMVLENWRSIKSKKEQTYKKYMQIYRYFFLRYIENVTLNRFGNIKFTKQF